MESALITPTLDDVLAAHERIRPYIHETPVLTSRIIDEAAGAQLFFKCENLQKAGAFKARGASNAVFGLSDAQAARGVATHSSGNHGTCLSYAAGRRGIPCTVVMPRWLSDQYKGWLPGFSVADSRSRLRNHTSLPVDTHIPCSDKVLNRESRGS